MNRDGPPTLAAARRLCASIQEQDGQLYALVDTARHDHEITEWVLSLGDAARCLYVGRAASRMIGVAPYVVLLDDERLSLLIRRACSPIPPHRNFTPTSGFSNRNF